MIAGQRHDALLDARMFEQPQQLLFLVGDLAAVQRADVVGIPHARQVRRHAHAELGLDRARTRISSCRIEARVVRRWRLVGTVRVEDVDPCEHGAVVGFVEQAQGRIDGLRRGTRRLGRDHALEALPKPGVRRGEQVEARGRERVPSGVAEQFREHDGIVGEHRLVVGDAAVPRMQAGEDRDVRRHRDVDRRPAVREGHAARAELAQRRGLDRDAAGKSLDVIAAVRVGGDQDHRARSALRDVQARSGNADQHIPLLRFREGERELDRLALGGSEVDQERMPARLEVQLESLLHLASRLEPGAQLDGGRGRTTARLEHAVLEGELPAIARGARYAREAPARLQEPGGAALERELHRQLARGITAEELDPRRRELAPSRLWRTRCARRQHEARAAPRALLRGLGCGSVVGAGREQRERGEQCGQLHGMDSRSWTSAAMPIPSRWPGSVVSGAP